MQTCLRYLAFLPLLFVSLPSWASRTSPEALVVMVYVSAHRCEWQHPKLKKSMQSAHAGWIKRNQKYVDRAKKRVDFKEIDSLYKARRNKDKPIPLETCKSYVRRLQNPANDIKK
ncbi:MAG: hypothetical protein GC149_07720 [Gammaproteobacteria bacterium]|nr:hypothetical protein [Gammaproteobacteria bacterium]